MGILFKTVPVSLSRCWRIVKWTCFKYSYRLFGRPDFAASLEGEQPCLGPFDEPEPLPLSIALDDDRFSAKEALHGTTATPEQCAHIPGGLWIEAEGKGECLRYYGHGLKDAQNAQVMVYLGGDVLLTSNHGVRHISPSYQEESPVRIEALVEEWSSRANAPAVFLARPGLYGSSGSHHRRRQLWEIELVDEALNALKSRFGIGSFILVGQSGGGQIVASLLGRRQDIAAAVLSSALLSVRQAVAHWEFQRDIPGRFLHDARSFHDPIDAIEQIPADPAPAIYVISDPEDRSVPFSVQLRYVRALRDAGRDVQHIFAHAPAPAHHVLAGHARLAAALVARGETAQTIRAQLGKLDWQTLSQNAQLPAPRPFKRQIAPVVAAQSAICVRLGADGETEELFVKSPQRRLPPASLTKLMTALLLHRLMKQFNLGLEEPLVIEESDVVSGSGLNVQPGERISLADAFANLLLPSSNITANAVARTFGQRLLKSAGMPAGKARARFVAEMNAMAATLGMTSTCFRNPSGQPARGQVTTAADMARLMAAVATVPEIVNCWGKPEHMMYVSGDKPRKQKIRSTVKVINDYDVLGGKTGTLLPGYYNLALFSQAPNDERLLTVILKSPDPHALYTDARTVLDAVKRSRDW